MNVFHDEDRVLPGFTEFYLVSLSCFVVLAQSKRTRLLLLFLATCGVVIQACRWIQRPSSVFVGFRCQKKVVPGRGAAFVFFLCALQLFLVPRTLGTGRKPRSKLNCWFFFWVLPSFTQFFVPDSWIPQSKRPRSRQNRFLEHTHVSWSRSKLESGSNYRYRVFFCCYLVFPGFLNHFPTETASFHEISSWNEAPNPGLTRSFNHRYRVFFFTEFFPQVSISNFFPQILL